MVRGREQSLFLHSVVKPNVLGLPALTTIPPPAACIPCIELLPGAQVARKESKLQYISNTRIPRELCQVASSGLLAPIPPPVAWSATGARGR